MIEVILQRYFVISIENRQTVKRIPTVYEDKLMPIAEDGKNVYKINVLCLVINGKRTLLKTHHKRTLAHNNTRNAENYEYG